MKAKAKTMGLECTTLFEIEIPRETIDKAFVEVYDEISKVANIPGFRIGKAPKDIVKKRHVNDAREEVLKRLIPDAYRCALAQANINPIGMPEISEISFEEGKPLFFKAKVETRPKFKLKDYKGIKIERKKGAIKDEDVDKTLENLRGLNAKYIAVEDRPVQAGDYVVSDLECFVDGKPLHKKRENLWLHMDKDSFTPALSDGMVGMTKGEERDIEIVLPEKYPDKTVAGKPARYHVKAKEIKSRVLPNLDDAFAKDLGKETIENLKKEIHGELERRMKGTIEIDMENQVLNKLMDDNIFQVPPSLINRQLDFMVEDAKSRLEEKGFKREELDKKNSEFRGKFKDDAPRQVRLFFLLDEIARIENISVSENDLEEAYKAIAAQTGETAEKVKDYYKKKGLVDSLKDKLKEEKTTKFLFANAEIKDV
ncbi:MAG: trigger factor [Candidatus Omnitrophica bacterium]|nr:trigger factor [Candidatus Omnitrophota bacterium]